MGYAELVTLFTLALPAISLAEGVKEKDIVEQLHVVKPGPGNKDIINELKGGRK